jgi:predicted HicB family RNase H-like nuclease
VEIRLVGDDVEFAYVEEHRPTAEGDGDLSSRITLRLSEQLKVKVEASASREGLSVNGWIVRVLERGTSVAKNRSGRVGSRLHGYGTS